MLSDLGRAVLRDIVRLTARPRAQCDVEPSVSNGSRSNIFVVKPCFGGASFADQGVPTAAPRFTCPTGRSSPSDLLPPLEGAVASLLCQSLVLQSFTTSFTTHHTTLLIAASYSPIVASSMDSVQVQGKGKRKALEAADGDQPERRISAAYTARIKKETDVSPDPPSLSNVQSHDQAPPPPTQSAGAIRPVAVTSDNAINNTAADRDTLTTGAVDACFQTLQSFPLHDVMYSTAVRTLVGHACAVTSASQPAGNVTTVLEQILSRLDGRNVDPAKRQEITNAVMGMWLSQQVANFARDMPSLTVVSNTMVAFIDALPEALRRCLPAQAGAALQYLGQAGSLPAQDEFTAAERPSRQAGTALRQSYEGQRAMSHLERNTTLPVLVGPPTGPPDPLRALGGAAPRPSHWAGPSIQDSASDAVKAEAQASPAGTQGSAFTASQAALAGQGSHRRLGGSPRIEGRAPDVDLERLRQRGHDERAKNFQTRFPDSYDLFHFHVEGFRPWLPAHCRNFLNHHGFITRFVWNELQAEHRRPWLRLHMQLLGGDSEPIALTPGNLGQALIQQQNIGQRLAEEIATTQSARQSDTQQHLSARPSTAQDAPASLLNPNLARNVQQEAVDALGRQPQAPTMVDFVLIKGSSTMAMYTVNTPNAPFPDITRAELDDACASVFAADAKPHNARQLSDKTWAMTFTSKGAAASAMEKPIMLRGVPQWADYVDGLAPTTFLWTDSELGVSEAEVYKRVVRAFAGRAVQPEVFRLDTRGANGFSKLYAGQHYIVRFPPSQNPRLFSFFIPVYPEGLATHRTAWFKAINFRKGCALCKEKHKQGMLCEHAKRIKPTLGQ